jgi:hypothetical protein
MKKGKGRKERMGNEEETKKGERGRKENYLNTATCKI